MTEHIVECLTTLRKAGGRGRQTDDSPWLPLLRGVGPSVRDDRLGEEGRRRRMCTCGHSERDHAPCGKCLVEGCDCEVFERKKA